MNYTGLGYANRYKVDRPLTKQERQERLDPSRRSGFEPLDALTTVRINSTYLEVVDRWYALKGTAVWMALLIMLPFAWFVPQFLGVAIERNGFEDWMFFLFSFGMLSAFLAAAFFLGFRLEAFRWTHYPIRLNRKTRQVHAFRQDGSVLTVPWDELFLHVGHSNPPLAGEELDVRAHVLDADGETVRETFTPGFVFLGADTAVMTQWEFLRRYMEEPDYLPEAHRHVEIANPVHDRREGFVHGVMRSFGLGARYPLLQLLMSPMLTLNSIGRWIAMVTSKIPRWPAEVEAACRVDLDDPYRKDWRNNIKLGFWELWWPMICFTVGLVPVVWGATALVRVLAN